MQEINLYTEEFRPKKVVLSLEQMLLLTVLVVIVLAGASWFMQSLVQDRKDEWAGKQGKLEELTARVEAMRVRADGLVLDESLVQANARLSASLQARLNLFDMLGRVVVQQGDSFSATLVALARQRVEGLWLTQISLHASGQGLALAGQTLNSESVPTYLQKLREEATFRGRTFNLFSLNREEESGGRALNFVLRSEANDRFQPFAMATEAQETPLVSPEAQHDLLQQMRGVSP